MSRSAIFQAPVLIPVILFSTFQLIGWLWLCWFCATGIGFHLGVHLVSSCPGGICSCFWYILVLGYAIVRSIFNHLLVGTPGGVLLPVLQSLFSPYVTYIWFGPLGSGLVEGAWPPSLRGWHCGVPMWCSFIPYDSIPSLRGIYPNHVVHWFCPVHSCILGTFTGWIHSIQFLGYLLWVE